MPLKKFCNKIPSFYQTYFSSINDYHQKHFMKSEVNIARKWVHKTWFMFYKLEPRQ